MDAPTNKTDIGVKILSSLTKAGAATSNAEVNPTAELKAGSAIKGVVDQIKAISPELAKTLLAKSTSATNTAPAAKAPSTLANSSSPSSAAQSNTKLPINIESLLQSIASSNKTAMLADIKIGRHVATIVSVIPLKAGDAVVLTGRGDGSLNFDPKLNQSLITRLNLQSPAQAGGPANALATAANNTSTLSNALKGLPQTTRAAHAEPGSRASGQTLTAEQVAAITTELKRVLPQQQPLHKSIQTLNNALKVIQQHAQYFDNTITTKSAAIDSLTVLINRTIDTARPITGLQVQTALQNSGQFLESKLVNTLLRHNQAQPEAKQSITAQSANNDVKHLLLQATQALPQSQGATPTSAIKPDTALDALLKQFIAFQPATPLNKNNKQDATQRLMAAIAQASQSGLARIRSNQLQQLLLMDGASIEANRPALSLEVPIKLWDNIFPLSLNFQEKWRTEDDEKEEKKQTKENKQKKKSYWTMFMEFELEQLGKVAAEVKVHKDENGQQNMSTLLWAEREPTRRKIQQKIHTLKKELESTGITVNNMECSENAPPLTKQVNITQSLIDITT